MQQTPAGRGNTTTHHRTLPAATTTPALTSLESLSVAAWPINQRENVVMADWQSITPLSPPAKIFQGWLALYGLHGDDLDREQLLAPLELSASQLLL